MARTGHFASGISIHILGFCRSPCGQNGTGAVQASRQYRAESFPRMSPMARENVLTIQQNVLLLRKTNNTLSLVVTSWIVSSEATTARSEMCTTMHSATIWERKGNMHRRCDENIASNNRYKNHRSDDKDESDGHPIPRPLDLKTPCCPGKGKARRPPDTDSRPSIVTSHP